jgi:hypothetical protein
MDIEETLTKDRESLEERNGPDRQAEPGAMDDRWRDLAETWRERALKYAEVGLAAGLFPRADQPPEWVEGLPTEPGDYWFSILRAPHPRYITQGSCFMTANNVVMSVAKDFICPQDINGTTRRVWHMPLYLPPPPSFDATCPSCEGTGKKEWRECYDCQGKGSLA